MKNLLIWLVVIAAGGCMYQPPLIISQPPGPSSTTVQSAPPTTVPPTGHVPVAPVPQTIEVWRPDPTAGIVQNTSRTLFVRLWIDSRPPSPPTLELGPEQAAPVYVPLGSHVVYGEGRIRTPAYGWMSVGTMSRRFDLRNWSSQWGGYAWRLDVNDSDFGR